MSKTITTIHNREHFASRVLNDKSQESLWAVACTIASERAYKKNNYLERMRACIKAMEELLAVAADPKPHALPMFGGTRKRGAA